MVAMGHYAQVEHGPKESRLIRGADTNKDQTYFLAQVPQQATTCIVSIGHLEKHEVRQIAKELHLDSVSAKKDSTGICFIGERNFKAFLSNYLPSKDGDIVDIESLEVIGRHAGVLYYTIGQRKGLGIGGNKGPWFVVGKDVEKNVEENETGYFGYTGSHTVGTSSSMGVLNTREDRKNSKRK